MAELHEPRLSDRARARRDAALPQLLSVLRGRRRQRHLARAALAVGLLAAVVAGFWPRAVAAPAVPPEPIAAAPRWTMVRDDPLVLARCRVVTSVRAEWFLDDRGLQEMLREAERPEGLVRARGQVLVSAAAVDPFPTLQP